MSTLEQNNPSRCTVMVIVILIGLLPSIAFASPFPKWDRVVESMGEIKPIAHATDAIEQARVVSHYINKHYAYMADTEDYWKTPVEFLADGSGDCEDFAIAKYYFLLKAGVSDDDMEILVGETAKNERHAVLIVKGQVFNTQGGDDITNPAYYINRNGWRRP